ncbi:unnamed protein product [Prunus armeniaca]
MTLVALLGEGLGISVKCLRGFPEGHSDLPLGSSTEGRVSGGAIANTPRFSRVSGVASGSAKIGGWGLSMLGCD